MATVYEVELTEEQDAFVKARIAAGEYRDAAEVMQAALRLFEKRKEKLRLRREALLRACQVGIDELDRGEGIELNSREELRAFIRQIGEDAKARVNSTKP